MKVNLNVYPYCHSYYQELIQRPPGGVEYTGLFRLGDTSYVSGGNVLTRGVLFAENAAEHLWGALNTPSFRPALAGDLVHSERLVAGYKPYVVSFDHVGFLTDYRFGRLFEMAGERAFDRYLDSDRCRRLLPWSEAARRSFENVVGEQFERKMEVLYPAVASREVAVDHRSAGPDHLLFVATDFYQKGGYEVLGAFDRLREEFDVELTVISNTPGEVQNRYADAPVTFHPPTFSREELYAEFYAGADVLVHPTHNDSFGMVYLEAMNAGLPVVTTDVFASTEIVSDGETGEVVGRPETCLFTEDDRPNPDWTDMDAIRKQLETPDSAVVDELVEATARLLADADRRQEYGERAKERVDSGRFSIQRRNEQLERLYAECLP